MHIQVNKKILQCILILVPLLLAMISISVNYYHFNTNSSFSILIYKTFDLDHEGNLPTWYASFTLLFSSSLLWLIAVYYRKEKLKFYGHWLFLSIFFLYMSLDEFIGIHEKATGPLVEKFGFSGYLYDAWVIVWGPLVIIIFLLYLRFLFHLPNTVRNLFITGGCCYVGGAIGVEMITANYAYHHGMNNLTYIMMEQGEESLEMFGISLFIYGLALKLAKSTQVL